MKYSRLAYILPLGFFLGCVAPASSDDDGVDSFSEATTPAGLTATLALPTAERGNFNNAPLTITNHSHNTITNWQVLTSVDSTTIITGVSEGAEVIRMGPSSCTSCLVAWNPGPKGAPLAPGASVTIIFGGTTRVATNYVTIASVDGEASGTPGANWPSDGVDHIARAVASSAAALLVDYENTKLSNSSPADPNYAVYDGLLLSAHMFTLNSTANAIEFNPNAPGYRFISSHTRSLLAAMQSNTEIATYLSVGLQSCFAGTNGRSIYTVKATPFKGLTGAGSGGSWRTIAGGAAGTTDQYKLTVMAETGGDLITLDLKTTTDTQFGAAYAMPSTSSLVSSAVSAKFGSVPTYSSPRSQSAACTPFNGPGGGTANPYFLVSLGINGVAPAPSPAYLQNQPTPCTNSSCTATLVIDPLAYQTPPAPGSTLGSTSNPFAYDVTSNWAIGTYRGGYGSYISGGVRVLGTFSVAQTAPSKGGPIPTGNYIWQRCGQPGAGC